MACAFFYARKWFALFSFLVVNIYALIIVSYIEIKSVDNALGYI